MSISNNNQTSSNMEDDREEIAMDVDAPRVELLEKKDESEEESEDNQDHPDDDADSVREYKAGTAPATWYHPVDPSVRLTSPVWGLVLAIASGHP